MTTRKSPIELELTRPDPLELAWAAGLWDGEGCCSLRQNRYPRLVMSMTNLQALERFHSVVQVGTIRQRRGLSLGSRKTAWDWRLEKYDQVLAVMELLWDHLCDEKQDQFVRILNVATTPYLQRQEVRYA